MVQRKSSKDWKIPGVKVYYIDEKLRLRIGIILQVKEVTTSCEMINQHIGADKTPVIINVPNNELKQETT